MCSHFQPTQNNDKVGVILYTDQVERYIPPKKGRRHILRVIRDILFFEPKSRQTAHINALDYLNRVQNRRTVTFLISDFLDDTQGDQLFSKLALTNRRHDLICVALSDPREHTLPSVGLITLEDAETGETVEVDTNSSIIRQRYTELNQERRKNFAGNMRKKGLDWVEAQTDKPYLPALRELFARRAKRY